jgi:hypothetical protein
MVIKINPFVSYSVKKKNIFLATVSFLIIVSNLRLFEFIPLENKFPFGILNKLTIIFFSLLFFLNIKSFAKPDKVLVLWFLGVCGSGFVSIGLWNQLLGDTVDVLLPLLNIFFYFFLKLFKVPVHYLINIIVLVGIAHIAFLFINIFSGLRLFGYDDYTSVIGGVLAKFKFSGRLYSYFAFFILLERIIIKFKKINLLLLIFLLIGFILMGRRVMLLGIILGSIVLFYYYFKLSIKLVLLLMMVVIGGYIFIDYYFGYIFELLYVNTSENLEQGDDYIRIKAANYFFFDFQDSFVQYLFGNGPFHPDSRYGEKIQSLQTRKQFYLADIGLIGFYTLYGLLTTLAFLTIIKKMLNTQYVRTKAFKVLAIFVVFMMFFNVEFFSNEAFLFMGLTYYIMEKEKSNCVLINNKSYFENIIYLKS